MTSRSKRLPPRTRNPATPRWLGFLCLLGGLFVAPLGWATATPDWQGYWQTDVDYTLAHTPKGPPAQQARMRAYYSSGDDALIFDQQTLTIRLAGLAFTYHYRIVAQQQACYEVKLQEQPRQRYRFCREAHRLIWQDPEENNRIVRGFVRRP